MSNTYQTVLYFSCVLLGSFPVYKKLGTVQLKKFHFLEHPIIHLGRDNVNVADVLQMTFSKAFFFQ